MQTDSRSRITIIQRLVGRPPMFFSCTLFLHFVLHFVLRFPIFASLSPTLSFTLSCSFSQFPSFVLHFVLHFVALAPAEKALVSGAVKKTPRSCIIRLMSPTRPMSPISISTKRGHFQTALGKEDGDPNGNRTRAAAVKGRCPNR